MSPDQHAEEVRLVRPWHKRPALRYSLCDVCDKPVHTFTMWQEPCPTAADGLLFGHKECVRHSDGLDDAGKLEP